MSIVYELQRYKVECGKEQKTRVAEEISLNKREKTVRAEGKATQAKQPKSKEHSISHSLIY